MKIIENFNDYEVLSTSNGYKYERWGKYYLKRPDPEIIWPGNENIKVNAVYERSSTGGGNWTLNNVPSSWTVNYKDLKFNVNIDMLMDKFIIMFNGVDSDEYSSNQTI